MNINFFLTNKTLESFHNYGYRVNEGYGRVVFSQVSLVADASEKLLGRDACFLVLTQAMGEFALG